MTTTAPPTVDAGPKYRVREGDSLWYVHPTTGERFVSVTSVLDYAANAGLADYWKPGLSAKAALAELPRLIRATRLTPCGRTYSRCRSGEDGHDRRVRCDACPCDECATCVEVWLRNQHFTESRKARERGSAVHHWIESWVLTDGEQRGIDDAFKPYVVTFLNFVTDFGLTPASWELAEATVLNRVHGWGGTLDGRIRFRAEGTPRARELCARFGKAEVLLSDDTKSREKEEGAFFAPMSLQLSAYRRGEVVLLDDGTEVALEPDDGAVVIQLRPNGYDVRPVRTRDDEYQAFVALLGFARWSIEHAAGSVAVRSFPVLPIPGLEPPAKRMRAAKSTPAKAALAVEPVKRTAAATATKRTATARATKASAQPVLPEPPRQSTLDLIKSAGRRPAHPGSPYGDEIPF